MELLQTVVIAAKQAEPLTIGINANFDSISTAAYTRNIGDRMIHTLSSMAPEHLNTQQKVRFAEILTASMPQTAESPTEGRFMLM